MRTLIFGPMPEGASPREYVAAGAFCFVGREALFPGWDNPEAGDERYFSLPPDPYPDGDAVLAAAQAANSEVLRLARLYTGDSGLSEQYRLLAAGPFFLLAVHMLSERQKRVTDLVKRYGAEPLRVPLVPPDTPFSFADSLDFMVHGVQDQHFNHYIYSRIAEACAPPAWKLEYGESVPLHQMSVRTHTLRERVKHSLRGLLLRLPFPRMKGFSLWQSLALSVAALCNKREKNDCSLDFSRYCDGIVTWRFPAEELIMACMPETLRSASHPCPRRKKDAAPGPLRGMSPVFSQDDRYRLALARQKERGARIFCVQHGANYGNLKSVGILPFEYSQHAFFTWGWQRHGQVPANAVPLPHPMLGRIAGKHREKEPLLILVGTEMSSFSYRLKSRPQSGALPAYRAGKVRFLRAVQEGLAGTRGAVAYRPYFAAAGALEDGAFVRRELPSVPLCEGDLTARMLGCRMLALDHYGTTLHMALAANVPLVAFWRREDWDMERESAETLAILAEAGILHETPGQAAAQALAVWDDTGAWWRSEAVRNARQTWLMRYARVTNGPEPSRGADSPARQWFCALRRA